MYTALVLDSQSQKLLQTHFADQIPNNWDFKCHHMTINMGKANTGPAFPVLGQQFELTVTSLGLNEKVIAVGVETVVPSTNRIKHITLAVNILQGGKPKDSNEITNWVKLSSILKLTGVVQELM